MINPGGSPQAEQLAVMQRESAGKGATLGDVLKDKLQNLGGVPKGGAEAKNE
jgi:hypothetical protein